MRERERDSTKRYVKGREVGEIKQREWYVVILEAEDGGQ